MRPTQTSVKDIDPCGVVEMKATVDRIFGPKPCTPCEEADVGEMEGEVAEIIWGKDGDVVAVDEDEPAKRAEGEKGEQTGCGPFRPAHFHWPGNGAGFKPIKRGAREAGGQREPCDKGRQMATGSGERQRCAYGGETDREEESSGEFHFDGLPSGRGDEAGMTVGGVAVGAGLDGSKSGLRPGKMPWNFFTLR